MDISKRLAKLGITQVISSIAYRASKWCTCVQKAVISLQSSLYMPTEMEKLPPARICIPRGSLDLAVARVG